MRTRLQSLFTTSMMGVALTVLPASATTVVNTNFQAWRTTVTGGAFTVVDFSAVGNGSYNSSTGITLSGFNFTGPNNGAFNLSGGQVSGGTQALLGSSDAGAQIAVSTPAGGKNAMILAVGGTGGQPVLVSLSDGETFNVTSPLFGFSISHPITSFTLSTAAGSQAYITDLYFGASNLTQDSTGGGSGPTTDPPAAASEGGTLAMLAGGLLVLFGWRRKQAVIPAVAV